MEFSPLPGKTFGAVVAGKHVTDFDEQDWADVQRAFAEFGFLVFPNQFLSGKAQVDFCRRFGKAFEPLITNRPEYPCVPIGNCHGKTLLEELNSRKSHEEILKAATVVTDTEALKTAVQNEYWHVDSTYMPIVAKAGTLNAVEVPGVGGGTAFADAAAAYDTLDESLRQRINDLQAYHSIQYSKLRDEDRDHWGENLKVPLYGGHGDAFLHKVVKTHPETGRKAICVGRHAFRIEGLDRSASLALIREVNAHVAAAPERVYVHQWAPGELGIWDNRRLFHKAMPYDVTQRRLLVAIRITGDDSEKSEDSSNSKAFLEAEFAALRAEKGLDVNAKL